MKKLILFLFLSFWGTSFLHAQDLQFFNSINNNNRTTPSPPNINIQVPTYNSTPNYQTNPVNGLHIENDREVIDLKITPGKDIQFKSGYSRENPNYLNYLEINRNESKKNTQELIGKTIELGKDIYEATKGGKLAKVNLVFGVAFSSSDLDESPEQYNAFKQRNVPNYHNVNYETTDPANTQNNIFLNVSPNNQYQSKPTLGPQERKTLVDNSNISPNNQYQRKPNLVPQERKTLVDNSDYIKQYKANEELIKNGKPINISPNNQYQSKPTLGPQERKTPTNNQSKPNLGPQERKTPTNNQSKPNLGPQERKTPTNNQSKPNLSPQERKTPTNNSPNKSINEPKNSNPNNKTEKDYNRQREIFDHK